MARRMYVKYTIGCDPELFVYDYEYNRFVSAHDLMPGDKQAPYPVTDGAIQVDGVSAEFNINPALNKAMFIRHISNVKYAMLDIIQSNNNQLGLKAVPTATFDREYFDNLPEGTKALGCEPDFNAYTGEMNTPPETDEPFRTGSGHVHVGYGIPAWWDEQEYQEDVRKRIQQLDAVLFLSSLLWDNDEKRRTLYGNLGAFRYKPYGFEYRPLSNAFLNDEELIGWVYDATVKAMELYDEGKKYKTLAQIPDRDGLLRWQNFLVSEGFPSLPRLYTLS